MGVIDDLVKQLPYGDGAWRRRFISGIIFFTILVSYDYVTNPDKFPELFNSGGNISPLLSRDCLKSHFS